MDILRFEQACETVREGRRLQKGIGTLSETSVHAVLKNYYGSYQDQQEQPIGRYIADIVNEDGIIEIQTGRFKALKNKLAAFLPVARVTVVYPVIRNRQIICLDEEGNVKSSRRSPKKGRACDIFNELWGIAEFLCDPNFSLKIAIIDCEETRSPQKSKISGRRRKYTLEDRMPVRLVEEIGINSLCDWSKLLPCMNEPYFTSADAAETGNTDSKTASAALSALYKAGILERNGKKGNSYIYSFSSEVTM